MEAACGDRALLAARHEDLAGFRWFSASPRGSLYCNLQYKTRSGFKKASKMLHFLMFLRITLSSCHLGILLCCHVVTLSPWQWECSDILAWHGMTNLAQGHHVISSKHHCFLFQYIRSHVVSDIFLPSTDIHLSPKHWHQHCMWLYLSGCCSVPWLRAILGPSWGHLGAIWGHFVFVLGPSWVHFGAVLGFKHGLTTIHGFRTEHGYMICVLIINAPVT